MNEIAELERLNRGFIYAVQSSDSVWFDRHLAEDFLNTTPDCTLMGRADFLKHIAKPPGLSDLKEHDVNVRVIGEVAIIHAKTTYTKADGRPAAGRYTDVWAQRDGRWLCVAAHVNRG